MGVIVHVSSPETIQLKDRRQKTRSYATVIDESCCAITLTLWGEICQRNLALTNGDIVALKGGKISDFGCKSVNVADDHASMTINP